MMVINISLSFCQINLPEGRLLLLDPGKQLFRYTGRSVPNPLSSERKIVVRRGKIALCFCAAYREPTKNGEQNAQIEHETDHGCKRVPVSVKL